MELQVAMVAAAAALLGALVGQLGPLLREMSQYQKRRRESVINAITDARLQAELLNPGIVLTAPDPVYAPRFEPKRDLVEAYKSVRSLTAVAVVHPKEELRLLAYESAIQLREFADALERAAFAYSHMGPVPGPISDSALRNADDRHQEAQARYTAVCQSLERLADAARKSRLST